MHPCPIRARRLERESLVLSWPLWVSRAKWCREVVGTWLKLRLGKPVLEKEEFLQSTVNHIGRASFGGD